MIDYDLISRSKDLLTGCPFGNALGRGVSMLYVKRKVKRKETALRL